MNHIWNEIRFTLRGFRSSPVFAAVAIFSLALGIGANTAIFTLLDQILLRLLPVSSPRELVLLTMRGPHYGSNWGGNAISYPMYKDFSAHNQVFTGMFARFPFPTTLGYSGRTERVDAELVSGTYFPVLGVTAAIGRTFTPDDDKTPGGQPVVVLSNAFWRSRFASDPSIVGKELDIDGRKMTCIGVAQAGFDGVEPPNRAKIFIPLMMEAQLTPLKDGLTDRRQRWVNAFGRLKPGITAKQAKASLQPFMHSMLEMEVKEAAFHNAAAFTRQQFLTCWIDVLPGSQGRSFVRQAMTTPLWLLLGVTGAVLLMACANLANLLLARATGRQREFAIRLAIGAGRGHIIRQMLLESFLLSFFGGVAGLLLAYWADNFLLKTFLSADNDTVISAAPDARILAFTFGVTLLTSLLFGLLPAIQASRPDVAPTLKDQAGAVIGGGSVLLRKILVIAQVTLSLLLLIGAGLFLRTLMNLRDLGPGFRTDRLMAFDVDPSLNGYKIERLMAYYQDLTARLTSIPGVTSVGMSAVRILEENEWDSSMTVEGYQAKEGESPEPYMNMITPNYFAAMGVPILRGRDFTMHDTTQLKHGPEPDNFVPSTVMINESFVRKFFQGRDPIGRHVGFGSDPGTKTDMEVIGVVKDIKYTSVRDEIPPQAFIPLYGNSRANGMTVYVRSSGDPKQVMSSIRREVHSLDPNVPLYSMRTEDEQLDASLRTERLISSLCSVFGFLATLLAVVGLYGVMAYTVSRRTREIGIRVALGAARSSVINMVMREVLLLIGLGVLIGVPLSIGLSSLVRSQLFGLVPHDPITIGFASALLALVAAFAGFVPAMRASRIDPMRALRYE
jgi:predicted permease